MSEVGIAPNISRSMRSTAFPYRRCDIAIHYDIVRWDANQLSYADFRVGVLGATDPAAAAAGSA